MMRRLDALICRIGTHRWTGPVVLQTSHARVVSRYCMRCDATSHVEQAVWSDPLRASRLSAVKGCGASPRMTFGGGDAA